MHRRKLCEIVSSCSMSAIEPSPLQLLLRTDADQAIGVTAHKKGRCNLYGKAIFGFTQNRSRIETGRSRCKSQAYPADYAAIGPRRQSARPQHLQAASGTHQISISAGKYNSGEASGGMEYRHYVYSFANRICISRCCYRLVQSFCFVLSSFKQFRDEFLSGCTRRGLRNARKAPNFQHRSRDAIYFKRIRASDLKSKYTFQHGWQRKGLRQCFHRTFMEIGEV